MAINTSQNNALDSFQVPKTVYNAIRNAAAKTGVDFTYLVEKAAAESSFDANAKAKTSSATGLFQFIESTWMSMVKQHGDKYGLSKYVDKIDDNGKVSDSKTRKEILNLRKDPEISSLMAGEFANGNYDYLQKHVGGNIGSTELYMAHFLGAGGASGFLNAMNKSPNAIAADLFPKEARANRGVFYDSKSGAPRSLQQIYALFDKKFEGSPDQPVTQSIMTAQNGLEFSPNHKKLLAMTNNNNQYNIQDDPFARLAGLVSNPLAQTSPLRLSNDEKVEKSWQIFPQTLYGNLSLTSAQMMLLNDFTA